MGVSYKKLWKLLIDKDMTKGDLRLATGASSATVARLARNELVSMDFLLRICSSLECNIGDIIDVVPEKEKSVSVEKWNSDLKEA